jgi:hypothetical protein
MRITVPVIATETDPIPMGAGTLLRAITWTFTGPSYFTIGEQSDGISGHPTVSDPIDGSTKKYYITSDAAGRSTPIEIPNTLESNEIVLKFNAAVTGSPMVIDLVFSKFGNR